MSDNSPVFLVQTHDYEDNYLVVGEGLPVGRKRTSCNGCYVQARIVYDFSDSAGNPLEKEQILDQYWVDDWLNELMDKYKVDDNNYGNIRQIMKEFMYTEYESGEYPRTIRELNDYWWKLNKMIKYLLIKGELELRKID